ncbi:MAG TPA: hypothetical protein VHC63_03710 [Acidimicrobiales bacterium]|nr:hypothetical protein [Acidimicrobiales bacterium]
MTENPAVPTDEAQSLLNVVRDAQASTSARLRALMPEFLLLAAATCFGLGVERPEHPVHILWFCFLGATALLAARHDVIRRRNLGGALPKPSVWAISGMVLVADVTAALALHGDARDAVIGIGFAGGAVAFAAIHRNVVLLVPALLIAVLLPLPSGPLNTAFSFAAGMGSALVVGAVGRKRSRAKKGIRS